ncbi:MAG: SH3 domain-containing protein [Chloroflexi bacterium]|nr:SH3 domain-containing protein [Chloroflexota bacterium]
MPHPITDPLRKYDLPLYLWGARPVWAEPFGPHSFGWSLAVAEPWFAEANPRVYPSTRSEPEPFALNIGADRQGRLSVAAIGENARTGARVALLGDAEWVQNGFGLRTDSSGNVLAGNWLLAQRLTAWLMRREASLELPDGILWLAMDGKSDDWEANGAAAGVVDDVTGDAFLAAYDIASVHGLRTDSYAYLRIDPRMPPQNGARVSLDFDPNRDGRPEATLVFDRTGATIGIGDGARQPIPDAAFAAGSVIELRIPLRLVNPVTALTNLCLSLDDGAGATVEPDCVDAPLLIPLSADADAAPLRAVPGTPLATVTSDGVNRANVRSDPGAGANVVSSLGVNSIVAVLGRSEANDWYYVQTAAVEGWVSGLALTFAGDPAQIPVREG